LLALSLTACSSSDSASAASASHGLDAATPDAAAVSCDNSDTIDLEGQWALVAQFALQLRSQTGGMVTMCPVGQQGEAMMSFLVNITQDASAPNGLTMQASACSLDLPTLSAMAGSCVPDSSAILAVQIPIPELLTSVLPNTVEAPVKAYHDGTSIMSGFRADRMTFTFGGRSDRPALPRWQIDRDNCGLSDFELGHKKLCETACIDDCAAMYDDDNDGYPGVTVDVCGFTQDDLSSKVQCRFDFPNQAGSTLQGRMSMVFRAGLSLIGNARSSCELNGTFDSVTTYSVLGAEAYLTNTNIPVASVIKSLPLFDADPENSHFRMIRVVDYKLNGQSPSQACTVIRSHKNDLI
jgi:hypothetical protein